MKIAIDIDDVLSDTISTLLEYYNENFEPKVDLKELPQYSYWGFLGKTREEANKNFFAFAESAHFLKIKPHQDSFRAIDLLSENHELYAITGRPFFLKEKTEKWLSDYFPGKFSGAYFTNSRTDKSDFSAYWGRPKAEICGEIGAEVLIEDLFEYARESDGLKVFIIDRPWNKGKLDGHMTRVASWDEIVKRISSFNA